MDDYSIENTHEALKQRLIDYVETAYFGKNDELRELCRTELETQGVMWKEPYIEANPAYMSLCDGIENADIPYYDFTNEKTSQRTNHFFIYF